MGKKDITEWVLNQIENIYGHRIDRQKFIDLLESSPLSENE